MFFAVPNQPRLQDTDKVVHCRVTIFQGQAKTCLRSETETTEVPSRGNQGEETRASSRDRYS